MRRGKLLFRPILMGEDRMVDITAGIVVGGMVDIVGGTMVAGGILGLQ